MLLPLQAVVDEVEAFRAKVNDAVAVTDSLNDHKQNWLEQKSCLKAQIARFDAICSVVVYVRKQSLKFGISLVIIEY